MSSPLTRGPRPSLPHRRHARRAGDPDLSAVAREMPRLLGPEPIAKAVAATDDAIVLRIFAVFRQFGSGAELSRSTILFHTGLTNRRYQLYSILDALAEDGRLTARDKRDTRAPGGFARLYKLAPPSSSSNARGGER